MIWLLLYALTRTSFSPTSIWANGWHSHVFWWHPLDLSPYKREQICDTMKIMLSGSLFNSILLLPEGLSSTTTQNHSTTHHKTKFFSPTRQFTAKKVHRNSINCYDFDVYLIYLRKTIFRSGAGKFSDGESW